MRSGGSGEEREGGRERGESRMTGGSSDVRSDGRGGRISGCSESGSGERGIGESGSGKRSGERGGCCSGWQRMK